jgi:hypothetical protein
MSTFVRQWWSLVKPLGGLRGGQRLIYADALFMRQPVSWLSAIEQCDDPRSVALRGLLTACILGYYEQALEIARLLRDAQKISAHELDDVVMFIEAGQKTIWRAVSDVARASSRLAQRLRQLGRRD